MRVALKSIGLILLAAGGLCAAGADIQGKVISTKGGAPIPNAAVLLRASPDRESYIAQTDAAGRFAIAGVAPGSYQCEPARAGFGGKPPDRSPTTAYFPHITVAEGQQVTNLVLRLTPLGAITGRVVDPDGRPVRDVDVNAMQYVYSARGKTLTVRRRVISDDRGQFRFSSLYPGVYYLWAVPLPEGFVSGYGSFGPAGINRRWIPTPRNEIRGPAPLPLSATYYPSAADPSQARALDLAAAGEADIGEIRLQRRGVYSIRGKAPEGAEPGAVQVEKRPPDSAVRIGPARIGEDGRFSIPGLAPGSYTLTLIETPEGGAARYARTVVDIADHDVEGTQLTFAPARQISGVVQIRGEKPAKPADLPVTLRPADGSTPMATAFVKADGSFTIERIVPDLYRVTIGYNPCMIFEPPKPPLSVYLTSVKLGDMDIPEGLLDLRAGGKETLTLTASGDMGSLQGKVLTAGGEAVPASYITLIPDQTSWDWQSRYQETSADFDGNFAFEKIVPGSYTVFAWNDAPQGAPQSSEFRAPYEKQGVPVIIKPNGRQTVSLTAVEQ